MSAPGNLAPHTQGRQEWVTARDGRRLNAMVLPCPGPDPGSPGNRPTVVFEAGAAASRSSWALVQPLVGAWTPAVVYDRSGLGRSPADPGRRTLHRMAIDLEDVLDHFGPGPFVLVGHSAGGPIVRAAAARGLDRIAGLVLVDPADEGADMFFGRAFRRAEQVAARTGLLLARARLLGHLYRSHTAALPPDARRDMQREGFTVGVLKTQQAQSRTFLRELSAIRDTPPDLGSLPVTVVSGGRTGDGMSAAVRRAANTAHERRAALSPRGRHVIAGRLLHRPAGPTPVEPDHPQGLGTARGRKQPFSVGELRISGMGTRLIMILVMTAQNSDNRPSRKQKLQEKQRRQLSVVDTVDKAEAKVRKAEAELAVAVAEAVQVFGGEQAASEELDMPTEVISRFLGMVENAADDAGSTSEATEPGGADEKGKADLVTA